MSEATYRRSPEVGELAAALASAQGQFPEVPRNRSVSVSTRSGGTYQFRYASLDAILAAVRRPLAENGLAISQLVESGNGATIPVLRTVLMHKSGQWIESVAPIISAGGNQEFGSALSYMRRYALSALLGIASQEDDDGNVADGNHVGEVAAPEAEDPGGPEEPRRASERQRRLIYALSKERGKSHEEMVALMDAMFAVSSSRELTVRQASTLIEHLQKLPPVDVWAAAGASNEEVPF